MASKYCYKSKDGYPIKGVYLLPNTETGFGPDSKTFVIFKRNGDYCVGKNYNSAEGWWLGGLYGYKTEADARKDIVEICKDDYKRTGRWVDIFDLHYVVDKGNHNMLDNYGVYDSAVKAFAKARRLTVEFGGKYDLEVKQADGSVMGILHLVSPNTVSVYFPESERTGIIDKNGYLR